MSATAQPDLIAVFGRDDARGASASVGRLERPVIRIATFAALALYGVVRWSRLMSPAPMGRLLALVIVALLVAACGIVLGPRRRALIALIGVVAALVMFPLAGIPLGWATHLRVAATANGIEEGLLALPRVFVPYSGVNEWVRTTYVLGAGVLLICAGLILAFAPRRPGDLWRACAAVPLIVLAIVPSTVVHPQFPYLQGLLLFALLAAFVWGERIRSDAAGWGLAACAIAGAGAMLAAPALDSHRPWINYQALAGDLSRQQLEVFDWSQRYGPLNLPRTNREVLDVKASRPDYWKTENLDLFDGRAWASWAVDPANALPRPDQAALGRWSQTLKVTIRGMTTSDVVGAGFASQPSRAPSQVLKGISPGTWTAGAELGPGDSYVVRAYAPHPSATQLASAGSAYPAAALRPYLELTVPQSSFTAPQQVAFAPFVTHVAPENVSDQPTGSGLEVLANSPYASAAALARSLASRSATPYAYVLAVERYLSSSPFSYNESPPQTPYPLATFLTSEKLGYCQQFAGGMALMLRMGGIPARVATGFTTGTYDTSAKQWVVSDWDAHAWVEAWFPRYGWVPFDPTPSAAPARGGRTPIAPFHDVGGATGGLRRGGARRDSAATAAGVGAARRHGGSSAPVVIGVTAALLGVLALGLWLTRAPEEPSAELLLAELERALARSGRPLAGGATLASLEQRFRSAPGAAAYIRALRLARFRGDQELPSLRQRRALRSELRAGLGLDGMFRAIWALPPRWGPHWPRRRGS